MDMAMNKSINQEKLNASVRYLDKLGEANVERVRSANPELAERLEKLGSLLNNEDFCRQFLACADKQAAVKLFADHGLTLIEEDITALVAQVKTIVKKLEENDGELSEEDLEQVAGGFWDWAGAIFGAIEGGLIVAMVGVIANTIAPGIGCVAMLAVAGAISGGLLGGVL